MTTTIAILRKTRTAADYVRSHARDAESRCRAAIVLRALADVHATAALRGAAGRADPAARRALLTAVADCAGADWLRAHAHDPDIGRLLTYLDTPGLVPSDPSDLDEVLATVLWASHGPQPAPA